jgi:hypothetical protein
MLTDSPNSTTVHPPSPILPREDAVAPTSGLVHIEAGEGEVTSGLKSLSTELLLHIGEYLTNPQSQINFNYVIARIKNERGEVQYGSLYTPAQLKFLVLKDRLEKIKTEFIDACRAIIGENAYNSLKLEELLEELQFQSFLFSIYNLSLLPQGPRSKVFEPLVVNLTSTTKKNLVAGLENIYNHTWQVLTQENVCQNQSKLAYELIPFLMELSVCIEVSGGSTLDPSEDINILEVIFSTLKNYSEVAPYLILNLAIQRFLKPQDMIASLFQFTKEEAEELVVEYRKSPHLSSPHSIALDSKQPDLLPRMLGLGSAKAAPKYN